MGNNILDKIINLKCNGTKSSMSIVTALLIFYMLVANNFIGNLYSGQLKDYISANRWVQHLIGCITMLLIIIEIGGVTDGYKALFYTIIGYIWFILTTKLDIQWNLAIIGLLIIGFVYEKQMFAKEESSEEDQALEETDKKKIRKGNKDMKRVIFITILTVTVIGTIMYLNKKRAQHGGSFDTLKFFLNAKN